MAITVTTKPVKTPYGKEWNRIQVDWTSDASGNASGNVDLWGYLIKVTTIPTNSPTALYDITIQDPDGGATLDAAGGLLLDRSATVSESKYTTTSGNAVPIVCLGTHVFSVANAGNAKSGTAIFYLVDDL